MNPSTLTLIQLSWTRDQLKRWDHLIKFAEQSKREGAAPNKAAPRNHD